MRTSAGLALILFTACSVGAQEVKPPAPATIQAGGASEEAPNVLNRDEAQRAIARAYPRLLRDAGVGGTVQVSMIVELDGTPSDFRVAESSGSAMLDSAAIASAGVLRFSPAVLNGRPERVRIHVPITFVLGAPPTTRGEADPQER